VSGLDAPTWVLQGIAIAVGGALGALVRGGLLIAATSLEAPRTRSRATASAILVANLAACVLLGAAARLTARAAADPGAAWTWAGEVAIAFATAGVCGSLSTFSTICADLAQLVRAGRFRLGALYLGAHLLGGPLAFRLGLTLAG